MRKYLLLIFLILSIAFFKASAQATLHGKVYELNTHISLQSIRITNLNTRQFAVSDSAGLFDIYASPGDVLAFRGYSYKSDTVAIINKNHLEIYLEHTSNLLNEVKISTPDAKVGSLRDPSLKGQPVVYLRDVKGDYTGGVALRFGYGKDKKAAHSKQLSDEETADREIDQAFSQLSISKIIPLRGQPLKDFVAMYRPERKAFKAHDFNLIVYVNDCYKKYNALPVDKRKPDVLGATAQ